MQPLFDDSLPLLLSQVERVLGKDGLDRGVVLREAGGRLTYFFDGPLPTAVRRDLETALSAALGSYARPDRLVADSGESGAAAIFVDPRMQWLPFAAGRVRYVDRRIVGVDWLLGPGDEPQGPPRLVFASLKGGVGRTTALCVTAADLASQGRNVLCVDLDLEAPGLGSLLIAESATPRLGVIDLLVESAHRKDLATLIPEMLAPSLLTQGAGRVEVVAAVGSATRPENFLGKLSRALLDLGPDGETWPLRDKLARLVDLLIADRSYDVVLIDARAGLAELSAGPLLGLGAKVLLFGTAQRQTVEDLRYLFAQFGALLPPQSRSPWGQLQMVLAKAVSDSEQHRWFLEQLHSLFQEYLYEEQEGLEGLNYAVDDRAGPHHPLVVGMNPVFGNWDPVRRPSDLTAAFYEGSFRPFLDGLKRIFPGLYPP